MWDVKTLYYLKKRPGSPFAFFLAGWAALLWGDADNAGEFFEGAVAADASYAPAYIGIVCREIALGRYNKAASLLHKYSARLSLSKSINRFRLAGAISACALPQIRIGADPGTGQDALASAGAGAGTGAVAVADSRVGAVAVAGARAGAGADAVAIAGAGAESDIIIKKSITKKRSFLLNIRYFTIDRIKRKLWAGNAAASDPEITPFIKLIRYIDLLQREATPAEADERKALAGSLCALPGLLDEFRFYTTADRARGVEDISFTFDAPAIFNKALLNNLFREKIFIGELREPRIILSNLRRDSDSSRIDNVNKWLFLQLSYAARRVGDIESETARELENDGWWADPLVRLYRRSKDIARG